MANNRAGPGEIIDVRPLGAALKDSRTRALFKTEQLEVIRLMVPMGKEIPIHKAPGDITVLCLEGRIDFTVGDDDVRTMVAGDLLYLEAEQLHSLLGIED